VIGSEITSRSDRQFHHVCGYLIRGQQETEILGDIVLDFFSETPRDSAGVVIGPSKRRRLDAIDLSTARLALRMFEVFSTPERLDLGLVTARRSLVSNDPDMAQNATMVVTPSTDEMEASARDQLSVFVKALRRLEADDEGA